MNILLKSWKWYSNVLDTRPLLSRVISTIPVLTAADAVSQITEEGPWNYRRTFGMALYAAVWVAPVSHTWFTFLSRNIPLKPPVLPRLLLTVALDQVVMSPLFITAFFTARGVIDRQDSEQIVHKIKTETWPVWQIGFGYWGPIALCNFYIIPLKHRVMAINFASFLWNGYMAARTRYDKSLAPANNQMVSEPEV